MRIVVIGGARPVGWKLADILRRKGHDVLVASPRSGVDTTTGEGLAKALRGARVVVDVAHPPSLEDLSALNYFERSGRNLLAAEVAAGVGHHVALSAVGADRLLESGYFRGRMTQEKLIRSSRVPYSILRSTQFADFMCGIVHAATKGRTVRLSSAAIQPILSDDVASALAALALGAPVNGIVEIAGPDRFRLDEFVRRFLAVIGDTRRVMTDPSARYFGARLDDRSLLPAEGTHIGASRFEDWAERAALRMSA